MRRKFGFGVFFKFLKSIGNTAIECPRCFKAHEFNDDNSKGTGLLIALVFFLGAGLIGAVVMGMLILIQAYLFGWYFVIELILPLIIGVIAGGIGLKLYHWRRKKLVLYGH